MLLRDDNSYRRYVSIVKTIDARVDLDKINREIKATHAARVLRDLNGRVPSATKVYEAVVKDAVDRARLVEILMQIVPEVDLLKKAGRAVRSHLRTSYSAKIKEYGSKVDDTKQVMSKLLAKGEDLEGRFDTTIKLIDLVVLDIDQGSYSTNKMTSLLEQILGRPGQQVV